MSYRRRLVWMWGGLRIRLGFDRWSCLERGRAMTFQPSYLSCDDLELHFERINLMCLVSDVLDLNRQNINVRCIWAMLWHNRPGANVVTVPLDMSPERTNLGVHSTKSIMEIGNHAPVVFEYGGVVMHGILQVLKCLGPGIVM